MAISPGMIKTCRNLATWFSGIFGCVTDDIAMEATKKVTKFAGAISDDVSPVFDDVAKRGLPTMDTGGRWRQKGKFVSSKEVGRQIDAYSSAQRKYGEALGGTVDLDPKNLQEAGASYKEYVGGATAKHGTGGGYAKNAKGQFVSPNDPRAKARDMGVRDRSYLEWTAEQQVESYRPSFLGNLAHNIGFHTPTGYTKTGIGSIDKAAEEAIGLKQGLGKGPIQHFMGNKEALWKTPSYHMTQARLGGEDMTLGQAWKKTIGQTIRGDHLLEFDDTNLMNRIMNAGEDGLNLADITKTISRGRVWGSRAAWGGGALVLGGGVAAYRGEIAHSRNMDMYGGTSLVGSPPVGPDPQMALDAHEDRAAY